MTRGVGGAAVQAPARTWVRAGALRLAAHARRGLQRWVAVAVLGFIIGTGAACDRLADSPPAEIELEGGRVVQLPAGAEVLEVELTARGRDTTFQPAAVTARPGDVVRFRATEGGTHALEFVGDSVQPAQRDFLERTNQRRAPPLIEQGAAWIVSLEGAPVGVYPFRCITHGERGRLTVQAPAS